MPEALYRTWIEISKQNIAKNYRAFRRLLKPQTKLMAVVKSNAYGHELFSFAKKQEMLGADFLGVDSITEARALRKTGIQKPILVLGYTLPKNFSLASDKKTSLSISSFENLRALAESGKKVSIHIKVDTGMHRQGFFVADLQTVCDIIKNSKNLKFEGLFTHFAAAKKPDSLHETERQIQNFDHAIKIVREKGFNPICHAAATAGTLNYPESHYDMVRIGIGLYGLWPSAETKAFLSKKLALEPVLAWKSLISELKWVEKNAKIGYDFTDTLKAKAKLAVVPIGYWHGYWRAFSSKAHVLVGGKRCRVVGRVSMDMVVIDITKVSNAKVGDEVILLGRQGRQEINADELAKIANTSNYEIVTRLNPLIKKIYK